MPVYTFGCRECGQTSEEILSAPAYADLVKANVETGRGWSDDSKTVPLVCGTCGTTGLFRATRLDWGSSYTERPMFWDEETCPEVLTGKGGYSRERTRILDKAGLVQKDSNTRHRRHNGKVSVYYNANKGAP